MNNFYLEGKLSTLKHNEQLAQMENERQALLFHTLETKNNKKRNLSLTKLRLSLHRIGIF